MKLSWFNICPIHDVRTVSYGWKADFCKWGFKHTSNKIKSIKGKKRRWIIGKKKLRMKRKTNYTEKRKNKQTTTTTKKIQKHAHTECRK